MNKEEVARLSAEALTGVNRVIETFEYLAPQGDALIRSEIRMSDDDALFYGRVASALSLLRACANRLILLSTENSVPPSPKLIEHQPARRRSVGRDSSARKLPTDDDEPPKSHWRGKTSKGPIGVPRVAAWIVKRLGRAPMPLSKNELVHDGMTAGISNPAIYHQIKKLLERGQIKKTGEDKLYLEKSENPQL
jgi:hypothetical protein